MAKIPRLTRYDDFTVKTDLLENLIEEDIYSKLEKTSNTVATLPSGSVLTIGNTRQTLSSNLTIDTSIVGLGGTEVAIASKTLYYVYAVLDNSTVSLIASIDEVKPSAYSLYKKVGAFYTDGNSDIFKVYFFGEINITFYECFITSLTASSQSPAGWVSSVSNNGSSRAAVVAPEFRTVDPFAASCDCENLGGSYTADAFAISNQTIPFFTVWPGINTNFQNVTLKVFKTGIDAVQPNWVIK